MMYETDNSRVLFEYLRDLSLDPTRLDAFRRDPESSLRDTKLTEEHKAILISRDSLAVRVALSPLIYAFEVVHDVVVVHDVTLVIVVLEDELTNDFALINEAGAETADPLEEQTEKEVVAA